MSEEKVLNKEQVEAIEYGEGPLLIIAGAGTGKTTVITERIKYLITKKNISPLEILALTFTEKASREMETRVDEALPLGYANMWISTFHSFADRILRDEALNIGLDSRYRLMTEAESVQLFRKNIFKFDLDYFRPLGNPNKFIGGMLQHFSRLKDEDVEPNQYLDWVKQQSFKVAKLQSKDDSGQARMTGENDEEIQKYQELAKAYKTYEEIKTKEGLMDFGDLIANVLKLFRTRPNILKNYQKKFKYILVDEFQDTNYSQNQLVMLLAGEKPNLTVVADDDQSIYRFRGAAVSNVIQFTGSYPKTKIVVLTKNYRSNQEILDKSYELIQNNNPDRLEVKEKIDKKLVSMRKDGKTEGESVEFLMADRVENEAEMVAKTIYNLKSFDKLRTSFKIYNYDFKDFAILVRANNHAEPFVRELARQGIPYQFLGPGMLYRQSEIKDLIAYLSVLYNFEDNVAMYRLLSMNNFKIEGRDLAAIVNFSRKNNISLFEGCEILGEIRDFGEIKNLVEKQTTKTLADLVKMIHRHLDLIKSQTAGQILYFFLEDTGLLKKLTDFETVDDEKKAQNIAKFFDKLKSYEANNEDASVYAIVDFINLSLELGESPLASDIDWVENDAVNILTVHSAKGLEFPVVFLVNLVSQRFPTTERREQIPIPEGLIKELLPQGDFHLQEERRLFYVGMTRAKNNLFLTAAKYYGEGKREKKVSPFAMEAIGEEVISNKREVIRSNEKQLSFFDFKPIDGQVLVNDSSTSHFSPISYLSYSQIETFNTCPLQYKYKCILRIPTPPSAALSFGDSIHQTMKDFYQRAIAGQDPNKNDLLKILDENWNPVGYPSKAHEEKYKKEGQKILNEFFDKSYDPKNLPISLEQVFSVKVSPTLKVGGRIDRIDQVRLGNSKDGIEIIDYKTGKSPTKKDVEKDLQMTIYAMAAMEETKEVKVSFYFFDNQEKISSFRKKEDFDKVKGELISKAEEISKSDFSPAPGKHCDFCEYKLLCEAWN